MSTMADELKLDIEELNELLRHANRQRSKDIIILEIRRLQTELAGLSEENKTLAVAKSASAVSSSSQKFYEVKLNSYGWDQTNTTVKLYITLKDVQQLTKSVSHQFTEKSVDLKIFGTDNKIYRFTINNLYEEIDKEKSSVTTKKYMVVVSLAKKVAKHWSHLTEVEKRIKESKAFSVPDISEDNDPGVSLMNLMKKMYEKGDDEMKKTIAKAWTESQEKKAAGLSDYS